MNDIHVMRCSLAAQDSFEVANESMDITVTLLDRFGSVITAKGLQAQLQPALLPLLDDPRTALRKRTITCLCAALQPACSKYVTVHCCVGVAVFDCVSADVTLSMYMVAQRRWRST